MEFSYRISEAEFRRGWKLRNNSILARVRKGAFLLFAFWVILFVGLVLLWSLVNHLSPSIPAAQPAQHAPAASQFSLSTFTFDIAPFIAVFGILGFVKLRQGPLRMRRTYRSDPQMQGEFTASISLDSISIQNTAGTSWHSAWSAYDFWREGKDLIVLVPFSGAFSVLNLAGLSEAQRNGLRAVLAPTLPKKW